jgi:hypothetical protein
VELPKVSATAYLGRYTPFAANDWLLLKHRPMNQAESSEPSAASTAETKAIDPEAWEVWRSLGDDAVSVHFENPSINHDCNLYANDQ